LLALSLENQTFNVGITSIINSCLNLQSLAMPLCYINEQSLFLIRNTSCHVRALDIFGSRFKEETLLFLFGNVFRNMQRVNLSGVKWLTLNVMKFICKRSPNLQSLSLKGHLLTVTDEYLDVIGDTLHGLHSIDLGLCRSVSNEAICRLIKACPALREAGFVGVQALLDSTLELLAQQCGRNLEKLTLGGCKKITDHGVAALASTCVNLRMFCVKGTSITQAKPLVDLVCANHRLNVISLSGVKGCSDIVIRAICNNCPDLKELYVSGNQVSNENIEQFRRVQPKCEVYGKRRRVATSI